MNWNSIFRQADAALKTSQHKAEVTKAVSKYMTRGGIDGGGTAIRPAAEAGNRFIEVLKAKIQERAGDDYSSGELGQTAIAIASTLSASAPKQDGNMFIIDISFSGDLARQSLNPDKYDGVDNIVALLNNGYDAAKRVSGVWHGEKYLSLKHRDGAHFIQDAVDEFMSSEAALYGVTEINVSEKYE